MFQFVASLKIVTFYRHDNHNIFMQLGFSVGNWQKVQLNTDLLKPETRYLYTKEMVQLKVNEINEGVN